MGRSSGNRVAKRLLELVDHVDGGKSLSIDDVRARFDIGYARAREYVGVLGDLRPLQSEWRGRAKVWYRSPIGGPAPKHIQRVASLEFAVRALSYLEGTDHHGQLRDLAEIERNTIIAADQLRLQRLSRSFRPVRHERPVDPDKMRRWVALILDAIERRQTCAMRYETLRGETGWYEINPWGLLLYRGRLLFAAGKKIPALRRPERRFFHFEGILSLEADEGPPFPEPRPEDLDFDEVLRDSFGIYCLEDEPTRQVHLRLRGRHAVALRQRKVHHSQHLERHGDEWWDLRLSIKICPEFEAFVLGMIPDVVIVEPSDLRVDLEARVRGWLGGKRS